MAGVNDNFAAAAMMRVITRGLEREGLPIPRPFPASDGARVPLTYKRVLLQTLLAAHGPALLLRLGQAVIEMPEEPAFTALAVARDPCDFLARWQRLERYVHGRHRVRVLDAAPGRAHLCHVSLRTNEPPEAAEHLVVWGVLIGLLQRLGTADLRYAVDLHAPAEVVLTWTSDEIWTPSSVPEAGEPTVVAAREALAADPAAPWTLARLAAALGLKPRVLQRRLGATGSGFRALWMQERLAASARLLVAEEAPTAEIGYRCGFADQAHFTRSFHRLAALTPARYRAEFAAGR
jgi:AraC-like DNA-binding protein